MGLSRQTISAIERGTVELSWNNYLVIMMFVLANQNKFKTMYQDDSQELIENLYIVDMKLQTVEEKYEVQRIDRL